MPQSDKTQDAAEMEAIKDIAWKKLHLRRLGPMGGEGDDFRMLHVTAIRAALSAAYRAGRESVKGGGQ